MTASEKNTAKEAGGTRKRRPEAGGAGRTGKRRPVHGRAGTDGTEKRRPASPEAGSARGRRGKRAGRARKQPLFDSFRHAFDGIAVGFGERNMKIHCAVAVLVVMFGAFLRISVTEWCLCLILFGLIMGLELVNTSVEAVVDLVTGEYHPLAKRAKDAAAGAVLIAAIMAAAAGLIIFLPKLLYFFRSLL